MTTRLMVDRWSEDSYSTSSREVWPAELQVYRSNETDEWCYDIGRYGRDGLHGKNLHDDGFDTEIAAQSAAERHMRHVLVQGLAQLERLVR